MGVTGGGAASVGVTGGGAASGDVTGGVAASGGVTGGGLAKWSAPCRRPTWTPAACRRGSTRMSPLCSGTS